MLYISNRILIRCSMCIFIDDLITFRLTSKQMARSAKKCDKNQATQKEKLKTVGKYIIIYVYVCI